jgi:hypothetical protein
VQRRMRVVGDVGRRADDHLRASLLIQFHKTLPTCRVLLAGVARWFVFKPKIPNLGKFWTAFEW